MGTQMRLEFSASLFTDGSDIIIRITPVRPHGDERAKPLAGLGVVYRTVIKLHTHLLVWGDISDPIRGYPPICPPFSRGFPMM